MTKKQLFELMDSEVAKTTAAFSWKGCTGCKERCDEAKALLAEGWTVDGANHWVDPKTGEKLTMDEVQKRKREAGIIVLSE